MLNSFRGVITQKAIQSRNGKLTVKNRTSWKNVLAHFPQKVFEFGIYFKLS